MNVSFCDKANRRSMSDAASQNLGLHTGFKAIGVGPHVQGKH